MNAYTQMEFLDDKEGDIISYFLINKTMREKIGVCQMMKFQI